MHAIPPPADDRHIHPLSDLNPLRSHILPHFVVCDLESVFEYTTAASIYEPWAKYLNS